MSNCPNVLDANKPSRELGIHTTVLNEIFHIYIYIYIYIPKVPKKTTFKYLRDGIR